MTARVSVTRSAGPGTWDPDRTRPEATNVLRLTPQSSPTSQPTACNPMVAEHTASSTTSEVSPSAWKTSNRQHVAPDPSDLQSCGVQRLHVPLLTSVQSGVTIAEVG